MKQENSKQKTPPKPPVMVKETFSIPMLERKMMFLNEPALMQAQQRQGVDQVKILWQVHEKQMSYHDKSKLKASNIDQSLEANEALHK